MHAYNTFNASNEIRERKKKKRKKDASRIKWLAKKNDYIWNSWSVVNCIHCSSSYLPAYPSSLATKYPTKKKKKSQKKKKKVSISMWNKYLCINKTLNLIHFLELDWNYQQQFANLRGCARKSWTLPTARQPCNWHLTVKLTPKTF